MTKAEKNIVKKSRNRRGDSAEKDSAIPAVVSIGIADAGSTGAKNIAPPHSDAPQAAAYGTNGAKDLPGVSVPVTNLRSLFPMYRDLEDILNEIHSDPELESIFRSWNEEDQKAFLDFCCGNHGIRVLYDNVFKYD